MRTPINFVFICVRKDGKCTAIIMGVLDFPPRNNYGCPQLSPPKFPPGFSSTTGFAIVVILLKVLWDIRLHIKERRIFAVSRAEPGST